MEKEVDKINEKEKAKTEVTKTSDSGDKNIEIDKESLAKVFYYDSNLTLTGQGGFPQM